MYPETYGDTPLTDEAHRLLIESLENYGNHLTEEHRQALYCILRRFTELATGAVSGRYAYPLPTGGGKTQSVVAWLTAVHRLNRPYSVAVCASRVKQLCEMIEHLKAAGVPDHKIGLLHSLKDAAPLKATEGNESRQFLFVTHARVRDPSKFGTYNRYRDGKRSLVVWDESLITADSRSVEWMNCLVPLAGLGEWLPLKGTDEQKAAHAYLLEAKAIIDKEFTRQADGQKALALTMPALDEEQVGAFVTALNALPRNTFNPASLVALVRISQQPLRLVKRENSPLGLICYDVVVPNDLDRVAVLDASWPIRELEKLDKSIKRDRAFKGEIKRYSNVTLYHLQHAAGRSSMTKNFNEKNRDDRTISREVCSVVEGIPKDEGIIIFTFKTRNATKRDSVDFAAILKGDLRADGIDIDAKLEDGNDRFVFRTFGEETSESRVAYCRNVIFAGVLFRSNTELAGAVLGQRDKLTGRITESEIIDVRRSEAAHVLYQALSRGSCRVSEGSEARPMKAWIIYPDDEIRTLLTKVMPGVVWRDWKPLYAAATEGSTVKIKCLLVRHLDKLPDHVRSVSSRELKRELGLTEVPPRTFTNAANKASKEPFFGWQLSGRSFVRI